MTVTYSDFINQFPEFATLETSKIERILNQTLLETDGYSALTKNEDIQNLAIMLHLAHNLVLDTRETNNEPGVKSQEKSHHDTITFAVKTLGHSLESSTYGYRLQSLLDSYTMGAIMV